jgi:hypothetical protein
MSLSCRVLVLHKLYSQGRKLSFVQDKMDRLHVPFLQTVAQVKVVYQNYIWLCRSWWLVFCRVDLISSLYAGLHGQVNQLEMAGRESYQLLHYPRMWLCLYAWLNVDGCDKNICVYQL